MAALLREQILERLRANLAAITGPNYSMANTALNRVVRVKRIDDDRLLDVTLDGVYAIAATSDETHTELESEAIEGRMEVFVLMLRKHEASSEQPFELTLESPGEELVVNRMVQDFLTALWADITLNGLAENVADDGVTINRQYEPHGLAAASARFVVLYSYPMDTP